MQYKMTADGANVSGTIRLKSKNKLLDVSGDYNAVFKVEGTLNKMTEKDVFDRYLVGIGKAIASKWLKYEAKAISNLTSQMNKAEKALEKVAKKEGQAKAMAEQKRLNSEFEKKAESDFGDQMNKFVGSAHSEALNTMDKTAKAVLKDKKKLIFKGVKVAVGLVVTIAAVAVAPPAGAALIAVAVIGCLGAAAKAAQDGIALSNEFIGNYKVYNKSLGELDAKISETIKFARACEAKRDRILIHKAQIQMKIEEIKKKDPGGVFKGNRGLKSMQAQLKSLNQSLDRLSDYSAKDVEKSLSTARGLIKDLRGEPYQERGEKATKALSLFQKVAEVAGSEIENHA